jgi:hypothetical protein
MKANPSSNSEARPLAALENSFRFWCALDAFLEAPDHTGPAQGLSSVFGSGKLDLNPLLNLYVESVNILQQYQQVLAKRAKQSGGKGYRQMLGDSNDAEVSPAFNALQGVVVWQYFIRTYPEQVSGVDFYRSLTQAFVFMMVWQANAIWTEPKQSFDLFKRALSEIASGEIVYVERQKHIQSFTHHQSFASGSAQIAVGLYRLAEEGQLEPLNELPEYDSRTSFQLLPAEPLPVAYQVEGKMRLSVAYLAESLSQGGSRCYIIPFSEPNSPEIVVGDEAMQSKWTAFIGIIEAMRPKTSPVSDVKQQRDALLKRLVGILNDNYPNVSKHARYIAAGSLAALLGLLDTEAEHADDPDRLSSYTSDLRQSVRNAVGSKAKL